MTIPIETFLTAWAALILLGFFLFEIVLRLIERGDRLKQIWCWLRHAGHPRVIVFGPYSYQCVECKRVWFEH